nr:MAG TPA: hypothetical protein [Caudoviricetes sp.]
MKISSIWYPSFFFFNRYIILFKHKFYLLCIY